MQHFVALFRLRLFMILLLHFVPIRLAIALESGSSVGASDDYLATRLPAGIDGSRRASVRCLFLVALDRRRAEETRAKFLNINRCCRGQENVGLRRREFVQRCVFLFVL